MIAANKTTAKCLVPGCTRPAQTRSVCKSCHHSIRAKIRAGEVTEEELITWGWLAPKYSKAIGVFTAALAEKRSKEGLCAGMCEPAKLQRAEVERRKAAVLAKRLEVTTNRSVP